MKNSFVIGFVLFAILYSHEALSQDKMKIVSYNTLYAFQDSMNREQYQQWIKEINPDIIAYEEMKGFTQEKLEKFASRYGHPYAVVSMEHGNPVALSSKYPIVNVQKVVDNMWVAYLYANIKGTHLFVVHLSAFEYRKRTEELRLILAHAATLPQTDPILIMGDFNAFSRKDADQYDQRIIKEIRERQERKTSAGRLNLKDNSIDYSAMDLLPAAGYTDTYWLNNKHFQKTMPTKKYDGTRVERRIDFIWANDVAAKRIKKSGIIYDNDTDEMSDHYPVYIELDHPLCILNNADF